jgi:diguanylate cyclase (GGDEF)-like protein
MANDDRPLRILCVDDDAERQHTYRHAMTAAQDRGRTVLMTETGSQGLSLAQTFRPDCLVVSDALPDMTCRDFIAGLPRPEGADSPALVIAASPGAEDDALAAMAAGADDFVQVSGMGSATLLRAVENAIRITQLRAGLAQAMRQIALGELDDPLTALPGRKLFQDRLTHAVILGKRTNQSVAVMLIELSAMKEINFLKGHAAGDAALREVARRMKATLREADTVARTSGNQFGVVLHTGATHEGSLVAARKILAAVEAPIAYEDGPMSIALNIGIALFPDHGEDGDTLLHHADAAMERAGHAGGGCNVFAYDDRLAASSENATSVA